MKKIFPLPHPAFAGFPVFVLLCLFCSPPTQAAEDLLAPFVLESFEENQLLVSKKPVVEWKSMIPLSTEPVLALLDGGDVSALVERQGNKFSFKPVLILPAGEHDLYISAIDTEGNPVEQQFFFSTRHSENFAEAYSNNELSFIYRGVTDHYTKVKEPPLDPVDSEWIIDDASVQPEQEKGDNFPNASINAYLASESVIREGNWTTSFVGNLRYFDQRADILEPEKRGLSLIDILLSTNYRGEKLNVDIGLGDNAIQESRNTVDNLYRRGLKAVIQYGEFTLSQS